MKHGYLSDEMLNDLDVEAVRAGGKYVRAELGDDPLIAKGGAASVPACRCSAAAFSHRAKQMYTCVSIIRWALNSYAEGLSYDKVACDECLWTDSGASEGDSYRNSGCFPARFSIQHPAAGPREVSRA